METRCLTGTFILFLSDSTDWIKAYVTGFGLYCEILYWFILGQSETVRR